MKIVGLVTEYNPFHNGHQYHIEKAKEVTEADAVIVIMSGDYVQRGMPAMMPKHLRAESALLNQASVVFELPVCYATGSAELFAYGAVSFLEQLGCVDAICFGSECGDIRQLQSLAAILCEEPDSYTRHLREYLKQGQAFPQARYLALQNSLKEPELADLLQSPNNILGIEYLKAMYQLHSSMTPYTIQRFQSDYHDQELQASHSSASAIRNHLATNRDLAGIDGQIPESTWKIWNRSYQKRFPVDADDFSLLLKYRLLFETVESLQEYPDVSSDLACRMIKKRNQYIGFSQFCLLLKTKEVTYSRISRILLHILLGIKSQDIRPHAYARILGFRKDQREVLSLIKKHSSLPLLSKVSSIEQLSKEAQSMLSQEVRVSNIYESVITDKYKTSFIHEYEKPVICI